jgi:oligopeptide/dipeptide ABC transporter ATP-binding protein
MNPGDGLQATGSGQGARGTQGRSGPLLRVENLQVGFDSEAGLIRAVDGVSFTLDTGRVLGLVGESGCGKSVTASSILRLVPTPPGRILGGSIWYQGVDLLNLPSKDLPAIRGKEIAMIFQDPMTSLNPVFTIEQQLGEVLRLRFGMDAAAARSRSIDMLRTVGIAEPEARLQSYPHELSGGMKQRVMIAMALLSEPKLLIADEPTTALDVTVQQQILYLIEDLQKRTGAAVLFITHDMGVIAQMCDDVAVMYAGRIVELGDVVQIFERSEHPYTKALLRSMPRQGVASKSELETIEGVVPSPLNLPPGCRFADRCWRRVERSEVEQRRCFEEDPKLERKEHTLAACHYPVGAVPLEPMEAHASQ